MTQAGLEWKHAIGKGVYEDIFSANGVLLVAASTIITGDHIQILEKHGVTLTHRDIFSVDTFADAASAVSHKMIDEAVVQVRELFEEVRETRRVPLAE